jgi:hypothetical protein
MLFLLPVFHQLTHQHQRFDAHNGLFRNPKNGCFGSGHPCGEFEPGTVCEFDNNALVGGSPMLLTL